MGTVRRWLAPVGDTPPIGTARAAVREITTRRGERASLRLADGTRVILAPDSRLRVSMHADRDIELDGEAYFDVAHDTAHPFRVRTPMGIAEDIGTTFVVSAYPEMRGMRVAVTSGIVALHRGAPSAGGARLSSSGTVARPPVILNSGDLGRLDADGSTSVMRHADLAPYAGWVEGRIVFDGISFAEAIPRIERWYDLRIELADASLGRERLVTVIGHDSEAEMLRLLSLAANARMERHGRVVRFSR